MDGVVRKLIKHQQTYKSTNKQNNTSANITFNSTLFQLYSYSAFHASEHLKVLTKGKNKK